jgi:hypothetical protein
VIHKTAEAVQSAYREVTNGGVLPEQAAAWIASTTLYVLVTWLIEDPAEGGMPYPEGVTAATWDESGYVKGYEHLVDRIGDLADMLAADADIPHADRLVGTLPREVVQTLRNVAAAAMRHGPLHGDLDNLARVSNAVEAADKALGRLR